MLEIRALEVAYGDIQVLWGIDLEVREGEIVSLVGSPSSSALMSGDAATIPLAYSNGMLASRVSGATRSAIPGCPGRKPASELKSARCTRN